MRTQLTKQTDLQAYKEVVHAELYLLRSHPVDWQPSRQDISRVWELYIAGLAYGEFTCSVKADDQDGTCQKRTFSPPMTSVSQQYSLS